MTACTLQASRTILKTPEIMLPRTSPLFSLQQQHAEFWTSASRDPTVENWLLSPCRTPHLSDCNIPPPNIDDSVGLRTSMLCQTPGCGMFGQAFHTYFELFVPVMKTNGTILGISLHNTAMGSFIRRIGRFARITTATGGEELLVTVLLKANNREGSNLLHLERYVDQGPVDQRMWVKDTALVRTNNERIPNQLFDVSYWTTSMQVPSKNVPSFLRPMSGLRQLDNFEMLKRRIGEYDFFDSRFDTTGHQILGVNRPSIDTITTSWTYSVHGLFCRNCKICVDETLPDELLTLRRVVASMYDSTAHFGRPIGGSMPLSPYYAVRQTQETDPMTPPAITYHQTRNNALRGALSSSPSSHISYDSAPSLHTSTPGRETEEAKPPAPRRTRRSYKNSNEPLTPTQIRNRLAAKRSNEKKRRYIQSVKAELSELHSVTVPRLRERLSKLEEENAELKRLAVNAFGEGVLKQGQSSAK